MKKKLLFIILPIVLILIAVGTIAALYFTTDIFKSDQEMFAKYFKQNIKILDVMENKKIDEQEQWKAINSYESNGNLLISIEDETNAQEVNCTTVTKHDANTGRTYSEMTLKKEEADLLKVSYINSEDIYALKCDDILGNYIGIQNNDLQTFAKNMGMSDAEVKKIPNMIDLASINHIGDLTAEQKQHIIDTYSKVIFDTIPEDKYTKLGQKQVSIDGKNYETNAYQLSLDENIIKKVIANCLTTLKNDNVTLSILKDKLSILGVNSEYTEIKNITELIDEAILQIQNETENNITLNIIVYESQGKLIKTTIELPNQGNITIDQTSANNGERVIVTVEEKESDGTEEDNYIINNKSTTFQIIFQKIETETVTSTEVKIIPDMDDTTQTITINTTIGKVQNNTINNSSDVTITKTSETNTESISASYSQTIQAVAEVEEIMELKSSNTVIVNNYSKEQLIPFLTSIGNKIGEVIPSKIGELEITLQTSQTNEGTNTTNIVNLANSIYKIVSMIGTAGVSIGNANGIKIENIGLIGIIGNKMYIYNQAQNAIASNDNLTEKEVQTYNAMFESFKGEQNGNTIKSLCDTARNHNLGNTGDPQNQVMIQMSSATEITTESTEEVTMESVSSIKEKIKSEKTYIVDFGYSSSTGKIVAIGITEK